MNVRATLTLRRGVVLLFAAVTLMQVCVGYAGQLDQVAVAPTSVTGNTCCETGQPDGCARPDFAYSPASCASAYCMEPRGVVAVDVAAPAAGVTAAAPESGRFRYREKPLLLAAAPPAISKTPLIYHLQRLLN